MVFVTEYKEGNVYQYQQISSITKTRLHPPFAIFGLLCQFGFLASHLTCLPCEQVALRNVVATSVSAVNKNWSHRNQCVITQVGM